MATYAQKLGTPDKTRNGPEATKATIRRNVLEALPDASVFDAFAGDGRMHDAIWQNAGGYVGCDLDLWMDDRPAFVADNRRVMRNISLADFQIFDFDSYGSPWEQVLILIGRRTVRAGERIGLVLTEGSGLKLKSGDAPSALRNLAGLRGRPAGVARMQDWLIDRAVAESARRLNCTVERRWQARGKTGSAMRYIGLVLRGNDAAS